MFGRSYREMVAKRSTPWTSIICELIGLFLSLDLISTTLPFTWPMRSHVIDLYKSYNLLPLDSLYNQQLLLFVFKCLYHTHLIPPIFCEYFLRNSQIHSHSTRTQNDLHILAPNTSFKKWTVKHKCSVLWNSLPGHMKTWSSVAAFKRVSKKFLFFLCNDD